MKILVTGANGYLGSGVVKQLIDNGVEVVAVDNKCDQIDKRAIIIECDLFTLENPFDFLGYPDVLLHMAWRNGFIHNDPSNIYDLPKHYEFIDKLVKNGCDHIAVMGTMHEVGFYEGSIKDDTPTHPESLYGISKDALRNIVKNICNKSGAIYQWLRGYYIVSNSEFGSSIFSKITTAEKKGQEWFPFTMGTNQYDFLNYDDFCKQVATVVQQKKIDGVINICNGRPEKLVDRVEQFIKENGYKIKLEYGKFPDRAYDSKALWGDDRKIRQIMENRKKIIKKGCIRL